MPTSEEIADAADKAMEAAKAASEAAAQAGEIAKKLRPDRLTRFNTVVTILTGMATALLAVAGTVIGIVANHKGEEIKNRTARIEADTAEVKKKLTGIELRERTEDSSYKFAEEFLKYLQSNHDTFAKRNDGKDSQIAVAALNVIAEASTDAGGLSDSAWRAVLPVKMALFLNDAGSIAAMDSKLVLADRWMEIARWDQDDQTQATAIKALCAICRSALRDPNQPDLGKALRCLGFADELRIRLSEKKERAGGGQNVSKEADDARAKAARIRADALTEMEIIYTELVKKEWKDPDDDRADDKAQIMRFLKTAIGDLHQATNTLATTVKAEASMKSERNTADAKANEQTLAKAQTVADNAQNIVAQQNVVSEGASEKREARVQELIHKLGDTSDEQGRHRARDDLALIGQDAVKGLIAALEAKNADLNPPATKTRLGVALALNRMRQPIDFDESQALWVVSLLYSPDPETRYATAELLMNLESDKSVNYCFNALEKIFRESISDPGRRGSTIWNAAVVIGTWARNLTKDTPSYVSGVGSMPERAWKTANEWRAKLKDSPRRGEWVKTIETLDELIRRAEPLWKQTERTAATQQTLKPARGAR